MGKLNIIMSITGIIVLLVIGGASYKWIFTKEHSTLYKNDTIIARHSWSVQAERTYINKDTWYSRNVMCPKIIAMGGYNTTTRCYYPSGYYDDLKRSLINTKIKNIGLMIFKNTPFYMYGTKGDYAGILNETSSFIDTEKIEEFPKDYNIYFKPKDTRNYKFVWRVTNLKKIDIPSGNYTLCSYKFDNIKIDLGGDCSKLDYAAVDKENNQIYFYFKPERNEQVFDVGLVDPEKETPLPQEAITFKDLVNESQERTFFNKKISRYNDKLIISDLEFSANWYPNNHPLKDYKDLTIEFQIENLDTNQNISLKGNGLIPKYYGGHFDINTSNSNLINLPYKLNWSYSTNSIEVEKIYNEPATDNLTSIEKLTKIKEKEYSNYIKIPDLSKTSVLTNFKDSYLDPSVSACGTLNTANTVNTLNQSVNTTGTCFTVSAQNVTIDCQGYVINYSSDGTVGYGVNSAVYNTTVKNCVIKEGITTGNNKHAIYFNGATNGTIYNNTIMSIGGSTGIYLFNSANFNNVFSNIIITSGNGAYGIGLYTSSNNNLFLNNTLSTSGGSSHGIFLATSSNNNLFSNININTGLGAGGYSFYIYNTNHNFTIQNSILNSSYAGVQEFYVLNRVTGGTWNFTNVTRSAGERINISWTASANGTLNMFWYLMTNITDNTTGAGIQNANVSVFNVNNNLIYSGLTDANGYIKATLQEYSNENNTLITYYNPYTVNTTWGGVINSTVINISQTLNTLLNIQFGVIAETVAAEKIFIGATDNRHNIQIQGQTVISTPTGKRYVK